MQKQHVKNKISIPFQRLNIFIFWGCFLVFQIEATEFVFWFYNKIWLSSWKFHACDTIFGLVWFFYKQHIVFYWQMIEWFPVIEYGGSVFYTIIYLWW